MTLFEEALERYVEAVQEVGRDEAGGETLHRKVHHMNAKHKALTDYVTALEKQNQDFRAAIQNKFGAGS